MQSIRIPPNAASIAALQPFLEAGAQPGESVVLDDDGVIAVVRYPADEPGQAARAGHAAGHGSEAAMKALRQAGSFLLRTLTAVVYAVLWAVAMLIVLIVSTFIQIDFLIRPTRRIYVPEPKDPNGLAEALRAHRIGVAVEGRYVRLPARDAELGRGWILHLGSPEGGE